MLVPLLPVSTSVLIVGAVLVLSGITVGAASRILPSAAATGVVLLAILLSGVSAASNSPCTTETAYNCIVIHEDPRRPGSFELILDGGYNSYVDTKDPTQLAYLYTVWIADAINAHEPRGKPLDAVFVGGGGFTLPRWLQATRPGSHSEVLELDPELVEVDEEQLGLETSSSLVSRTGDARVNMLKVPTDSADVVVGDAFSHRSVPWHLMTTEWLEEVRRVLKPTGLYALNVIDEPPLELMKAEASSLLDVFTDVKLIGIAPVEQLITRAK